jgi:hypothetical protein
MRALVLNGERKDENTLGLVEEALSRELEVNGWRTETIGLRDVNIARCAGCFDCWVKTPGVCVIDDFGRDVARKVVGSDLLVLLTPLTFGGYSSELKKAIDRFPCPLLLPFFTKIHGEVHHKPRYKLLPRLIGIGVLPHSDTEDEEIFKSLVARNAINLYSPAQAATVIYSHHDMKQIRKEVRSLIERVVK